MSVASLCRGAFQVLFRLASADDLAILADVDEIAHPHAIRMLSDCYPFGPNGTEPGKIILSAMEAKFGLHCILADPWLHGPHVYTLSFLHAHRALLRSSFSVQDDWRIRVLRSMRLITSSGGAPAAWHLTSFGDESQVRMKLTRWGYDRQPNPVLRRFLTPLARCAVDQTCAPAGKLAVVHASGGLPGTLLSKLPDAQPLWAHAQPREGADLHR
jgi:hypothetical protein